jgi:hypothetical protein
MIIKRTIATMLSVAFAALPGCILGVTGTSRTDGYVPPKVTDRVVPGETTKAWVIEQLGPPAKERVADDGTEYLTYCYTKKDTAKVAVFLVLGVSFDSEKTRTVEFQIRDGVVQGVRRRSA